MCVSCTMGLPEDIFGNTCTCLLVLFSLSLRTELTRGYESEVGEMWMEVPTHRDKVFDNPLRPVSFMDSITVCVSTCMVTSGCQYFLLSPTAECRLYSDIGSSKPSNGSTLWSRNGTVPTPTLQICPKYYTYNTVYESCLRLKNNPKRGHSKAQTECKDEDAKLLIVDTLAKHQEMSTFDDDVFWVDASEGEDDKLFWNNGELMDMSSNLWAEGQPSRRARESCIKVIHEEGVPKYDDAKCSTPESFVCELVVP